MKCVESELRGAPVAATLATGPTAASATTSQEHHATMAHEHFRKLVELKAAKKTF